MVGFVLLLSILFLGLSCRGTPPGPNGGALFTLSAEDASCTEAWLRITLDSWVQPRSLTLKRLLAEAGDDTVTVFSDLRLPYGTVGLTSDTLVVDEGPLLPNRTYKAYQPAGSRLFDFTNWTRLHNALCRI